MTKFKVGDKVRIIKPEVLDWITVVWCDELDSMLPRIHTITKINAEGNLEIDTSGYSVHPEWCELVKEEGLAFNTDGSFAINGDTYTTPDKTSIPPKMKIYIAGKITGLGEDEITYAFDKAKKLICDWGFEAVSPLDHGDESKSWVENMLILLPLLCECDGIYLLDNWHDSEGARIAKKFAGKKGMFMIKEVR